MTHYDKIFVIGFNKTATSTFHNIFIKNNLSSLHTSNWYNIAKFKCFSDNGDLHDFKNLYKLYPNSIFILNIRSIDKWLISRFKHGFRNYLNKKEENWAYPFTPEKCEKWINDREKHHLELLSFFKDKPEKLLIVNIEKKKWIYDFIKFFNFKNIKYDSKNVCKNYVDCKDIDRIVYDTLDKLNYSKNITLINNQDLLKEYQQIYKFL